MSLFHTPYKNKTEQYRCEIRSEQVQSQRNEIRQKMIKQQQARIQDKKFLQICVNLDVDCLNSETIMQLKKLCEDQGFILHEKRCKQLISILENLLLFSENYINDPEKLASNFKQKAIKSLGKIISVLNSQAIQHPSYCIYDGKEILKFLLTCLEKSTSHPIIDLTLEVVTRCSLNKNSKIFLIENQIFQIVAEPKFSSYLENIQCLLSVIFDSQEINIKQKITNQLHNLLVSHEKMFMDLNLEKLELLNHFVHDYLEKISKSKIIEIKKNSLLIECLLVILQKLASATIDTDRKQQFYCKIIHNLAKGLLLQTELYTKKQQALVKNFQMIHQIKRKAQPLYFELRQRSFGTNSDQISKSQLSSLEFTIDTFTRYLQMILKIIPSEPSIKNYAKNYIHFIYNIWTSEKSTTLLTVSHYRFFIKFCKKFNDDDFFNILFWCEYTLEDKECRNQSLKKLITGLKTGKISEVDYKRIWNIYDHQRQNFGQKFDELTYFLLFWQRVPEEYEIAQKQQQIQLSKYYQYLQQQKNISKQKVKVKISDSDSDQMEKLLQWRLKSEKKAKQRIFKEGQKKLKEKQIPAQ